MDQYPKCKKCGQDMEIKETELVSTAYDGVKRIYECEDCGISCEAHYNFEHIKPGHVFWSDDFKED